MQRLKGHGRVALGLHNCSERPWGGFSLEVGVVCFQRVTLTSWQRPSNGLSLHPEHFDRFLSKCRKERNRPFVLRLHAYMVKCGLEAHITFGNYLVVLLVEVGCIHTACAVFDKLVFRNEHSWNSLLIGYVRFGKPQQALSLYRLGKHESIGFNAYTVVELLKACTELKDVETGSDLHAHVAKMGLFKDDLFVGSSLVDMYAKCGSLVKAQQAFDDFPVRDVVLWTALIAGYVEHGQSEGALEWFEQMQLDGVVPNAVTLIFCLKSCGGIGAINKAQEIHVEIERRGLLERDLAVGNTLVDTYAKCGSFAVAKEVLYDITDRNVVTWTSLMAGYIEHGLNQEGLDCLRKMQIEGVLPDGAAYVFCLKACGSLGCITRGKEIHAEIEGQGFLAGNPFVGTTLVDMYANCGFLANAQEVSDKLPCRNAASWNALIAGYIEHERSKNALECFEQMQLEGISPDIVTYVCCLRACSNMGAIDKAQKIHAEMERGSFLENELAGNTLLDVYATCGSLTLAQQVFDELPVRNVVSWTALIAGYVEHGDGERALRCFEQMQVEGISPDAATFVCGLKACGCIRATTKGKELHAEIEKHGQLETDLVGNTLVDMYVKCGLLAKAQEVFETLPGRSFVSWNALITAYVEHGHCERALECFGEMQAEGVSPSAITFVSSLKAAVGMGDMEKVEFIHNEMERQGFLGKDPAIGTSLIKLYAKCGLLVKAQQVFDKLCIRDVVAWTALIAGYSEHGQCEEALKCYEKNKSEGVSPNAVTYICSLKACGQIGATDKAVELHVEIERQGLLESDLVGNTLVDTYCKCGDLERAKEVFDRLGVRDVVTWTALMSGYSEHGANKSVSHVLDIMLAEGIKPDPITFLVVLTSCNRTGEWGRCKTYYEAMSKEYGIAPTSAHQSCMVHLLGCAGHLDKAMAIISKMPAFPNLAVWHTVLGACKKWGNVQFGEHAFDQVMLLNQKDPSSYVLMAHIYASIDSPMG